MRDNLIYKLNLDKLENFANVLSKYLQNGDCLALYGDLGAGKTTFTSFLVKALGVKEKINSPTFTIVNEYFSSNSNIFIKHIDAYRLSENDEIGLEEFLDNSLVIIEWPENVKNFLPRKHIKISLEYLNEKERILKLELFGNYKEKLIEELKEKIQ